MTKKTHKHRRRRQDFIVAWLRSPLKTGAVLPSSPALGRQMAKQVDLSRPGTIVELGAGTGIVTFELLKSGVPPERLLVVEHDKKFHEILTESFKGPTFVCGDAAELDKILKDRRVGQVSTIVSSLPLITMPKKLREAIVAQMATLIHGGSTLIQFTFGITSPLNASERKRYGITGKHAKTVLTNVPPAHIWVYKSS